MLSTLRKKRILSEITLYDLARKAGIAASKLSLVERGIDSAQPEEQNRLAAVLNCEVAEIFPAEKDVLEDTSNPEKVLS